MKNILNMKKQNNMEIKLTPHQPTFNKIAQKYMKQWDYDKFKKDYPTLHKVIVEAMESEYERGKKDGEILSKYGTDSWIT